MFPSRTIIHQKLPTDKLSNLINEWNLSGKKCTLFNRKNSLFHLFSHSNAVNIRNIMKTHGFWYCCNSIACVIRDKHICSIRTVSKLDRIKTVFHPGEIAKK